MRFKLLGIIWDVSIVFAAIYAFTGLMLIGLVFYIPDMGWWNVLYFISMTCYFSTIESITRILTKETHDR